MKASTERFANDDFDNAFYDIQWNSAEIWDEQRQSLVKSALPVPVHSHNDYSRRIPLWEALGSGCISAEADVHFDESDLLVGHTSRSLNRNRSLRAMYLDPLQKLIAGQNHNTTGEDWRGIFNKAPQQTIVLLIDIKTSGKETFAELDAQLQPLRDLDFLTHWNGTARVMRPLTVVASGNAPFASILAMDASHRDIFLDAKLENLVSAGDDWSQGAPRFKFNVSNSYYASTRVANARVRPYAMYEPTGPEQEEALLRDSQIPQFVDVMDSQLNQAKARGLVTRYWDAPKQKNLEEVIWRWLLDNDVGVLNMDDMGTVRDRARGWSRTGRL